MPPARVALYVATVGALSLIARGLVLRPLPFYVPIAAVAGYLLLLGAGIAFLRLGMFVDVVWRGPREARGVALTFDDGPSPEHTPRILDQLDEAGAKATFFVIAKKALAHPDVLRSIAARGHAIGVHGYDHDRLLALRSPARVSDDIEKAIDAVTSITGKRPVLYRPPVGLTSPRVAQALEWFDVTVVGWSVRALDGVKGATSDRVVHRVTRGLRDGAIILLHDAAERDDFRPVSLEALPRILEAMRLRDLEGVRLDTWIGTDEAPRKRRKKRRKAKA
ncbi:Polysaccharide deacetylase [Minicystis rosea]|nr:Polysaccharide deacetylase [Minicystis rosea]